MLVAFIKWYLTFRGFERSGAFYRAIGIPAVDRVLARAFGEAPVEPYAPNLEANEASLRTKLFGGLYAEINNMMCNLIYLGMAIICFVTGYQFLAWWSIAIGSTHFIVVLIERYKRLLILEWLEHPEALTAPELEVEVAYPRTEKELRHFYFQPKPFESDKLFAALGVNWFRHFVFWLTNLGGVVADEETKKHEPHRLTGGSILALDAFEKKTRTSETVHLIGILQHLPYLIVFVYTHFWFGLLYFAGMAYLNIFSILLQRQHRLRVFKILMKRAQRTPKS
ncbi:MAG: hypothetical protein J0L72_09240 [Armatimonadetes bacterium]|nr:hypothetical protein [Armatimonadota bacterium]